MNRLRYLFLILLAVIATDAMPQNTSTPVRYQVAVFTPLFLDSAFDDINTYRYGKNFPKFINPGLEFYEGCMLAIDSLDKEGIPLDVHFYDTRSAASGIQQVVSNPVFDSTDLIIGHVNASEAKSLANAAAAKDIPFINVTYPNDAGVTNNPNFIILNSTLYTHCNAVYKYLQKYQAIKPVVVFRKKGAQEDRLQEYFEELTKNTNGVPLKIKYVTLGDYFTPEEVNKHLNTDGTTICIAGSLDISFGQLLAQHLASGLEENHAILIGMPNWWDVTDFSKPEFKGLMVIYTTPFYLSQADPLYIKINSEFKVRYFSRPTDMLFRGYETMYHFSHLLNINGKNLGSALSENKFTVFNDFDIRPVINSKTTTLDYFENKKIYIVRKVDGTVMDVY